MSGQSGPVRNMARTVVLLVLVVLVMPLLPLLITRDWGWWQAWALAAANSLGFVLSRIVVSRRYPDLIRDRAGTLGHDGVKTWDKWLAPAMAFGSLVPPVIAALEHLWTQTASAGLVTNLIGLGLIVLGYVLGTVAMLHNRFFAGQVRIQRERGHTVVSSGPYSVIRHPGYAGSLLANVGVPLLLDSLWAWAGVAALVVVTIVRTLLEDRTLQAELPGYRDYTQRVRFRLVPWIW